MQIRNIAIIAHVDHGKTTLVDALLRQSKTVLRKESAEQICIMDSNELEQERGITIFSKNASVVWKGTKINIIDTPGHADFGGEVERVLKMADGSLLLVDAKDGPMPQTRFVLKKALELKHKIIVVVNKVDQKNINVETTLNKIFDLFIDLGADDETADFPVIFASGRMGRAGLTPDIDKMSDISAVFNKIIEYIPSAGGNDNAPLQMLITSTYHDNFKGRVAKGRVYAGMLKAGQQVMHINRDGQMRKYQLTSVKIFEGLEAVDAETVPSGEIAAISGIPLITIGETIGDIDNPVSLPLLDIEEPTVKMQFSVNSSPFAAKESTFTTSRQIAERIYKELDNDVALKIEECKGGWTVSGRGELHLAILIERLRREGFAIQVSQPQVIEKIIDNKKHIPYEEVFIQVPEEYSGTVIQSLGNRQGEMRKMEEKDGTVYLEYLIPTRGLFGFQTEFISETHSMGIINTIFYKFLLEKAVFKDREHGSLVAHETGITRIYGLTNIQDRGMLFVGPNTFVYEGQVVGKNSRPGDMRVNVCKEKQLSNMRSKGDGVARHLDTAKIMSLENAIEYIDQTEVLDITPKAVRIRKIILNEAQARRSKKGLI